MTLASVTDRIAAAADRSGRSARDITLVAVSKSQPIEAIQAAYDLGHRDFGENRAQELARKAPSLPDDIRWHFIGPLQRNKVRIVRPSVVLLQSMDRMSLAAAWLKGPGAPPPVTLQVNIGLEDQKAGVAPHHAEEVLGDMIRLGLDVRGLMAIPPQVDDAEDARRWFGAMATLRDRLRSSGHDLPILSMGMTDDFEVAIEEGSTMIRVGRAIFGPRITRSEAP